MSNDSKTIDKIDYTSAIRRIYELEQQMQEMAVTVRKMTVICRYLGTQFEKLQAKPESAGLIVPSRMQ